MPLGALAADAKAVAREALHAQHLVQLREEHGVVHRRAELDVADVPRTVPEAQAARGAHRVLIDGSQHRIVEPATQRIVELIEGDRRDDALHAELANVIVREEGEAHLFDLRGAGEGTAGSTGGASSGESAAQASVERAGAGAHAHRRETGRGGRVSDDRGDGAAPRLRSASARELARLRTCLRRAGAIAAQGSLRAPALLFCLWPPAADSGKATASDVEK